MCKSDGHGQNEFPHPWRRNGDLRQNCSVSFLDEVLVSNFLVPSCKSLAVVGTNFEVRTRHARSSRIGWNWPVRAFYVRVRARNVQLARDLPYSGNLSACLHAYSMNRKRDLPCAALGANSKVILCFSRSVAVFLAIANCIELCECKRCFLIAAVSFPR
jgi:hypothetical protein